MSKSFSKIGKSILAGTSVISLISALNNEAYAVTRTTNSNTDITNAAGFTPNGFDDGDDLTFDGIHTVSFTTNPNRIINNANFDSFDGVMSVADGINVTTTTVKSNAFSYAGTLDFLGNSTFDGNTSSGVEAIGEIKVGNGTVNFTGTFFGAENGMNLTQVGSGVQFSGASAIVNLPINNTSGNDSSGSIVINNNIEFTGTIGASGARLEKMVFLTDSLVQAENGNADPIQITNTYPEAALGTGKGSLLLWYFVDIYDSQDINNDIGLSNLKLNTVSLYSTISENPTNEHVATLKTGKAIYANTLDIFPYTLTKEALDQSTLNIETNTIIDAHITTTPIGGEVTNTVGIVNVEGTSTLTGGIGENDNRMPEVNFSSTSSGDVVTLTGDIYAQVIKQESPNLVFTQDTLFAVASDSYHANNSTNSLGLNTLTINGNGDMTGTSVFNITADATHAGHLIVDSGNFDMTGISGMNLNLIDLTTDLPPGGERSYTIFAVLQNGGTVEIPTNSQVTFNKVSSTNPFVQWKYSNGVITQKVIPNVGPAIIDAGSGVTGSAQDNLVIIANSDAGARSDLVNALITGNAQELLDRLQMVITEVTEDSFNIIEDLLGDVSSNLNNKVKINDLRIAEEISLKGISAGDAAERYGVWASYSFSDNTQGQIGEKPGYKSRSNGGTIGVDTLINDETAVGVALGYTDTKIDHKDSNIGDTSRAKSVLLSLYSITELVNNWYVQAQLVFGRTKIDNTELRGTVARREYAHASFHSNAYAGSVETGYHFLTENKVMITPLIGLEFDVIDKSHYKESGTTNQNLDVRKSAQKKLIGHTGIMFAKNMQLGKYNVIPEIYAIVRHDFLNKNLKVIARLEGVENSLITRTAQNFPTFYNIGLGATSAIKNTDITLGYDHYFGKKYVSHQGTIKVRLNF